MALEIIFYPDKTPEERAELLRNSCDRILPGEKYTKHLTEEELIEYRRSKLEFDIQIAEKEEAFQVVKDEFKEEVKPLKAEQSRLLNAIRDRAIRAEGELFVIHDFESKYIGMYNDQGELVNQRRMTPTEQQGNIMSEIRISGV